jgi:hypothetical protein
MKVISSSKTTLFKLEPSLEDSARFDRVFIPLDFATIIFLQSKFVSFASNPQPGGSDLCICISPSDRVAQFYPTLGSLLVAFYDCRATVEVF